MIKGALASLLVGISLISCKTTSRSSLQGLSDQTATLNHDSQSASKHVRPLAEYEAMDTIILSFPLIPDAKGTVFRDEYSALMQKLLKETNAQIAFFTKEKNSTQLFFEFFPELRAFEKRISLEPIYSDLLPAGIDSEDSFGTWTRDGAPIAGVDESTGKPILYNMQYGERGELPYDDSIPLHFARTRGLEMIDIPLKNEGGNFMSTTNGVCAVSYGVYGKNDGAMSEADKAKILKEKMACKEVILLDEIPGAIAHSDMIAKFLDDHTVAITEYSTNEIYFNGKIKVCPSGYLDDEGCVEESWGKPAGNYDPLKLGEWFKAEAAKKATGTLATKIGFEGDELFNTGDELKRLKTLSDTWRKQFEDKGFKVIGLPTPPPQATLVLVNNDGKSWMNADMEYVTYANALIFDKKIFVPSYQYDSRIKAANKIALDAYRKAGWDVIDIETNELTKGREGSIHCMTMNVRTKK
jgi:agmatine/peptidylarginine deiminase